MPSEQSTSIQRDLWDLPASQTLSLADWRYAAGWREREPRPTGLKTREVDAGGVPAEWAWLAPDAGRDGPVALVLHGGGWIVCSIGTHRQLAAELAAAAGGGRAFVVGYRLAPEHPFPAAIDDSVAAYSWLLDSGVDASRVWFFGDSAGGNLCVSTCLRLREQGLRLPAALVLASPLVDLTFGSASTRSNADVDPFSRLDSPQLMVDYYVRDADVRDPLISPVFADLAGLPPMLTLVGSQEMLLDDARLLHEQATAAGVSSELGVVEGAFHTWLGYVGSLPEADDSVRRIGEFIQRTL